MIKSFVIKSVFSFCIRFNFRNSNNNYDIYIFKLTYILKNLFLLKGNFITLGSARIFFESNVKVCRRIIHNIRIKNMQTQWLVISGLFINDIIYNFSFYCKPLFYAYWPFSSDYIPKISIRLGFLLESVPIRTNCWACISKAGNSIWKLGNSCRPVRSNSRESKNEWLISWILEREEKSPLLSP